MSPLQRVSRYLLSSFVCLCACAASALAGTPQATMLAPQGGQIVYGAVAGATTQPQVLARLLGTVQARCGEKPQIGRVFQFRGTRSVGVFYTVTDRARGNKPMAGLVIASVTGPNQAEGALLTDEAARFGRTVNPMLQQLFSAWHPDAQTQSSRISGPGAARAAVPPLHTVTLPDGTARADIPAGWRVDPVSGGGTMLIRGSGGEVVILNSMFLALDPYGPAYRNLQQRGMSPLRGMIIYPANADLVKNFPQIILQLSRSKGFEPADLRIEYSGQVAAPAGATFEGERCALASGRIDPNGKGMQAMFRVVCALPPDQYGDFSFLDYVGYFPNTESSRANAIAAAIFASFEENQALVMERANAEAAPHIAQLRQMDAEQRRAEAARSAQIIGDIKQIGADATARMHAIEAANDAQHAQWNAGQDDNARNNQAFHNYILDQTVVQDNNMYGNGTVGHGTLWNSTADALVKADPDRFQYVDKPDFWQGTDYQR
ncbi:MAG: hypothetical protein U1F30_02620 [Steroidobacteraceae bacterium]